MGKLQQSLHWKRLDTRPISVDYIHSVDRIIEPTKARVDAMTKSLSGPLGQIEPILITKHLVNQWKVVAGATRLAAAKQLGWNEIEATIIGADNDFEYPLIEIAENLDRHDLSEAERRQLTATAKTLQAERLIVLEKALRHPSHTKGETTDVSDRPKGGRGNKGGVRDAARKSGVAESTARKHLKLRTPAIVRSLEPTVNTAVVVPVAAKPETVVAVEATGEQEARAFGAITHLLDRLSVELRDPAINWGRVIADVGSVEVRAIVNRLKAALDEYSTRKAVTAKADAAEAKAKMH